MKRDKRPAKRRQLWFANTSAGWLNRPVNFLAVAGLTMVAPLILIFIALFAMATELAIGILVLWGVAAVTMIAAAVAHRRLPAAYSVGPRGLTVQTLTGRSERHRWAAILGTRETADGLEVTTDTATLEVRLRPADATELATEIWHWLARQPGEPETIPPEQIAAWLGIGLDESLTMEASLWRRSAGVLWFACIAGWVLAMNRTGMPFISILWGACFGWLAWSAGRRDPVTISPYGIEYSGRRYGWEEVDCCRKSRFWTWLQAGSAAIPLYGTKRERVRYAVGQLLTAREAGAILPRLTDIPDHAISRAESAEVSAERGISPAEDGP